MPKAPHHHMNFTNSVKEPANGRFQMPDWRIQAAGFLYSKDGWTDHDRYT
jgi:hypothetical protein